MLLSLDLLEQTVEAVAELREKLASCVRTEDHGEQRSVLVDVINEVREELVGREVLEFEYHET